MVNAEYKVIARDQGDTQENNNKVTDTIIIDNVPDQNMDECTDRNGDGRRCNRGTAVRCRHNTVFKYKHIVSCQSWMDEQKQDSKPHTVSDYCRNIFAPNRMHYWMKNLSRWNNNEETIIKVAGNQLYRRMVTLSTNKRSKSPFSVMEILLMGKLKEHRTRGRKVSRCWICINTKKIQYDLDVKNGTRLSTWFKASSGWFHKFLRGITSNFESVSLEKRTQLMKILTRSFNFIHT